jgi:hypothetical protein
MQQKCNKNAFPMYGGAVCPQREPAPLSDVVWNIAWTKRQKHEKPKKAGILSLSNAFAVGRVMIGDLDRERRSAPSDRLFRLDPPRC